MYNVCVDIYIYIYVDMYMYLFSLQKGGLETEVRDGVATEVNVRD